MLIRIAARTIPSPVGPIKEMAMTRTIALVAALLFCPLSGAAQEIHLRAGTLVHCTLHEPDFSSRTALIGEPVVCYAGPLREFARSVLPRGSYLTGRLTDFREPGRLAGKGWLKLEFDRLVLSPNDEIPLLAKVVSVRGYRVDAEGRILGRGHPTRDAIGWSIPILWPVKLMTLPARGPRPCLRGEVPVTLRLLDDVPIPWGSPRPELSRR